MKTEIVTNLLGKIAMKRDVYAHCWMLDPHTEGEIVAVWLDDDRTVKIQVVTKDGATKGMWLDHVLVKDPHA